MFLTGLDSRSDFSVGCSADRATGDSYNSLRVEYIFRFVKELLSVLSETNEIKLPIASENGVFLCFKTLYTIVTILIVHQYTFEIKFI